MRFVLSRGKQISQWSSANVYSASRQVLLASRQIGADEQRPSRVSIACICAMCGLFSGQYVQVDSVPRLWKTGACVQATGGG